MPVGRATFHLVLEHTEKLSRQDETASVPGWSARGCCGWAGVLPTPAPAPTGVSLLCRLVLRIQQDVVWE